MPYFGQSVVIVASSVLLEMFPALQFKKRDLREPAKQAAHVAGIARTVVCGFGE